MIDLGFMAEMYMPLVLAFCLIVGYILKHWVKDVDNKLIPTILAILGAICACLCAKDAQSTPFDLVNYLRDTIVYRLVVVGERAKHVINEILN